MNAQRGKKTIEENDLIRIKSEIVRLVERNLKNRCILTSTLAYIRSLEKALNKK